MADAPATPVVPAASSATPSPAPTPAATSAPAAPLSPVPTPAAIDFSEPPAAPEAPVATPTETRGPQPDSSKYANDAAGQQRFLADLNRWRDGEEVTPETPIPEQPAAEPPAEEVKAEEPKEEPKSEDPKTEEPDEQELARDTTPEKLVEMLDGSPEFKAALEAAPEIKGRIFAMARENARLAPLGELYPTPESGKFAYDTANQYVGLKAAIQLAETPDLMNGALDKFMDEFKVVDDKGAPVLDASGRPTYGEDFKAFSSAITERSLAGLLGEVTERLRADKYASPEKKEADELLQGSVKFLQDQMAEAAGFEPDDLAELSPAQRERELKIRQKEEELGMREKRVTADQRKAERSTFEASIRAEMGQTVQQRFENFIKAKRDAGVLVPWAAELTDPVSGAPLLAVNILKEVQRQMLDPKIQAELVTLQSRKPNEQTKKDRLAFNQRVLDTMFDRVAKGELKKLQDKDIAAGQQKVAARKGLQQDARIEPRSAAASVPKQMTSQEAYTDARKQVLAELQAKGQPFDAQKLEQQALVRYHQLRG